MESGTRKDEWWSLKSYRANAKSSEHTTTHQCTDILALTGPYKLWSKTTGGCNYIMMSLIMYEGVQIASATKSTIDQPRHP
jgi:hypothetical protein